jgi:two-component system LytT family sensor kinase
MRPAIFVAASVVLGLLFALQEYARVLSWGYDIHLPILLLAWGLHFLLWGLICQILWLKLSLFIQTARLKEILIWMVPLSLITSALEQMIWVGSLPMVPLGNHSWTFFHRYKYYLHSEFINNLSLFWIAFCLFRGVSYYRKYREKASSTLKLESELAAAELRFLRMQLNPSFLFSTMASISELMRDDVEAADEMLEQLCSMLRVVLDKGDSQLIPLSEETEIVEIYNFIQDIRFEKQVRNYIAVDSEVLDAMVPTMILYQLVENAYKQVTMPSSKAFVGIEAQNFEGQLRICVRYLGQGQSKCGRDEVTEEDSGLKCVRERLDLHYANRERLSVSMFADGELHAVLLLPLVFRPREIETAASCA